jgi:hypothetical protein
VAVATFSKAVMTVSTLLPPANVGAALLLTMLLPCPWGDGATSLTFCCIVPSVDLLPSTSSIRGSWATRVPWVGETWGGAPTGASAGPADFGTDEKLGVRRSLVAGREETTSIREDVATGLCPTKVGMDPTLCGIA